MRQDNGAVLSSAGCSYYEDLRKVGMTYFLGAAHRAGFLLSEVRPCRDLNDAAALHVAFTRRIEKTLYDGSK